MNRKRRKEETQLIDNEKVIKELLNSGKCTRDPVTLHHDHIRIIVYVEKSTRMRFDSETIRFVDDFTTEPDKLQFFQPKSDTKQLGDMIFGEADHMIENGSFKIHHIGDKIMLSRIFAIPRERDVGSITDNLESEIRSAVQMWNIFVGNDASVQRHYSYFNTEPPEYLRKVSQAKMATLSRVPMRSGDYSISHGSSRRLGSTIKGLNTYRFTAIAILFDRSRDNFIYKNLHYIDREMKDLQQALFKSLCYGKKAFHYQAALASRRFRENLITFHNAQRFNLFVFSSLRAKLSYNDNGVTEFFQDFNDIITAYETKESGYFLSKLLSAVMMYHLTWVLTTNEVYRSKHERFWSVPEFYQNQSRPLMNAFGCVGALSHTSRIVLVGENAKHLSQLLHVLSYFVRFDRIPFDPTEDNSQREPNYSINNIWPFSVAEFLALKANRKTNNSAEEFNQNEEDLSKSADRWQLGEFGAMIAQKFKLREQQTDHVWAVKYDYTDNPQYRRHRARSEPQHPTMDEDFNVDNFRPRSSSNPTSRHPLANKKPLLPHSKIPIKPKLDKNFKDFSTPKGKLPYGSSQPFQNLKKEKSRKLQKYDAMAVWKKEAPPSKEELIYHSTEAYRRKSITETPTSSVLSPEDSQPPSPLPGPSTSASTLSLRDISSPPLPAHLIHYSPIKHIRAQRRKSITSLARALTKNSVYLHDPANPTEEEELYEQFLGRLLKVEFSLDDFGDHLSGWRNFPSTSILQTLIGGINDTFEPSFIMQGIDSTKLKYNLAEKVQSEVQHPESFYLVVPKDNEKTMNFRKPAFGNEKKEMEYIQMTSVIIVANLDDLKITVHSGDVHTYFEEEMVYPCDIIQTTIEQVKSMITENLHDNRAIILSLKEKLENLVRRASQLHYFIQSLDIPDSPDMMIKVAHEAHNKLLQELQQRRLHAEFEEKGPTEGNDPKTMVIADEKIDANLLVKILNCQYSDLRLLVNICSVLSPLVRAALL